jgi:hypothetical protein
MTSSMSVIWNRLRRNLLRELRHFSLGCRKLMLGFLLGRRVLFRPYEKLMQVVAEIGSNSRTSFADFLNDHVFHKVGGVRSSGVQITGMWSRL